MNKRPRFTALAACVAVPLLLSLAACSSTGSKNDSKPTAKSTVTALEWDTAFASCMRDQGFDYPDPSADGKTKPLEIDSPATQARYEKANGVCTPQTTQKLGEQPISDSDKKQLDDFAKQQLEINKCLRGKGYDVKDPKPGVSSSENLAARIPESALEACGYGKLGASQ